MATGTSWRGFGGCSGLAGSSGPAVATVWHWFSPQQGGGAGAGTPDVVNAAAPGDHAAAGIACPTEARATLAWNVNNT